MSKEQQPSTSATFIENSNTETPLPPRPPRVKFVKSLPPVEEDPGSPILLSDTEEVPSNQLVTNVKQEQEEDNSYSEFEQLSLLTQYIGPPKESTKTDRPNRKEAQITKEVTSFTETYLELIGTLDRATSHKESLTKAVQSGRNPAKLRITTKPMVINREDPKFTTAWDRAVKRCELTLVKVITDHLDDTIQHTNQVIRETTKTAYGRIKDIEPERAKKTIKTALASAEKERNLEAEQRKKKKERENTPSSEGTKNKKAPKDNLW